MKTLEPAWQQQRPNMDAVRTMWKKIRFNNIPVTDPVLLQYVHALKVGHANGGALLYHFQVEENLTFDWFTDRDRMNEMEFWNHFPLSDDIIAAAVELKIHRADFVPPESLFYSDAFQLIGHLSRRLYFGGPFHESLMSPVEAIHKTEQFLSGMIQDRFAEVMVFICQEPWSDWFFFSEWDFSCVIFDKSRRNLWLICLTDSD